MTCNWLESGPNVTPAYMSSNSGVMRSGVELNVVQESMLLPLWARAVESRKPDGLFRDPAAEYIADYFSEEIQSTQHPGSTQVTSNIRTLAFDKIVDSFLKETDEPLIVELGCGMSTRYERLGIPMCQWLDVDYPVTIRTRRKFFADSDWRTMIASDITDDTWLKTAVEKSSGEILIVAEGVLFYLEEAAVRNLFERLSASFDRCFVLFDAISPYWLDYADTHPASRYASQFHWSLESPRQLQEWSKKIEILHHITWKDMPQNLRAKLVEEGLQVDDTTYSINIALVESSEITSRQRK